MNKFILGSIFIPLLMVGNVEATSVYFGDNFQPQTAEEARNSFIDTITGLGYLEGLEDFSNVENSNLLNFWVGNTGSINTATINAGILSNNAWYNNGEEFIEVVFNTPVRAVGFDVLDYGPNNNRNSLTNPNDAFWGITTDFPVNTITLNFSSHKYVHYGVDNMIVGYPNAIPILDNQTEPVPEPTSMILFGLGLIGIARIKKEK